jgi:hypothetical protein
MEAAVHLLPLLMVVCEWRHSCEAHVTAALQRHRCAKETLVSFLLGLRLSLPLQMSTRGLPLNSAPSISHMLSAALLASDEKAREKKSSTAHAKAALQLTLCFQGCFACTDTSASRAITATPRITHHAEPRSPLQQMRRWVARDVQHVFDLTRHFPSRACAGRHVVAVPVSRMRQDRGSEKSGWKA